MSNSYKFYSDTKDIMKKYVSHSSVMSQEIIRTMDLMW